MANSWIGGLVVLARQPDQVELGPGEGRHLLALHRPLDGPDLVAQDGRALVLGPLGGGAISVASALTSVSWRPSRKSSTCSMSAR